MADGGTIGLRAPRPLVREPSPTAASRAATETTRDPEVLYRRLAPAVLGYLRAQGATNPEDLLMEVFVAVIRDVDGVRGDDDAVRRWVFTIAHHRLIDQRRAEGRRTRLDTSEIEHLERRTVADPATLGPDPDLVAALARLSPDQRDVVVLRTVVDLPVRDVARIVGKRPDAVKTLHRRGLARLARLLDG